MSDLSARKLSVTPADPNAKSKKLDETIEKLAAIRKDQNVMPRASLPTISAKKTDISQISDQENIINTTKIAQGSTLKGLRVTSAQSDIKQETGKIEFQKQEEKPKPTVHAPKITQKIEAPKPQPQSQTVFKKPVFKDMFEGDADNEPVLMLSPKNSMPMGRNLKYKAITLFGTALTVGWLGLTAFYIQSNMGFAEIFSQQPHILGGFLAGVLAPIALFWMIISHFQRGADIHMYSDALRNELQAMIFPSEDRKQMIHKDIEDLCKQAAELSASSQTVLTSIHRARVGLRNEIRDFSGLSKKTEFHIDRLADSLSERSKRLIELTNDIESRTTSLDAKTLSGAKAWDEAARTILARAGDIEQAMKKGAQQIVSAADEAEKTTGSIHDKLGASFEQLKSSVESVKSMTGNTVDAITQASKTIEESRDTLGNGAKLLADKAAEITESLNGSVSSIQESVETLVGKTAGIDERLSARVESLGHVLNDMEAKINDIDDKGEDATNKLSAAVASAISGADTIGSAVRRAIETLSRSTDDAKSQAEEVMKGAEDKITSLQAVGDKTADNMIAVLGMIDGSREKMESSSSLVEAQIQKLSAAVRAQSEEIEKVQDSLNERANTIGFNMNVPLEAMTRAVDSASEKHAAIEDTLSKRIVELNLASDKALNNTNMIRDNLRTQAQEISTLAGQLAGHSKSVQSMMSGQNNVLAENVREAIERIESVGQTLSTQSEKLSSISVIAQENISNLKGSLSGQCDSVHKDTTKVIDDLRALDHIIGDKVKNLISQSVEATQSVQELTASLEDSAERIDPVYAKAIDKIEITRDRFDKMSEGFEENTSSNLDKLKSMGILFDERLQMLTNSAQDASQILDGASENLSKKVTKIDSVTKAASERIQDMDKLLKQQASDIHLTTDQALLKIESIQTALNGQFLDLSSTVSESMTQIENVGEEYMRRAQQIKVTADDAVEKFDRAGNAADQQAQKLKGLAEETTQQMRVIVRSVQGEAKELLETSSKTFTEMKKTGDGFALRAREVEAQMKQSLITSQEYGKQMEEQSHRISENSHKNADQIAEAVTKLAGKMIEVNKAAEIVSGKIESSRDKLSVETENLADVAIKAARVVEESAQSYLRQSNSLFKATQDATAQAEKIKDTELRAQRNGFMTSAKFVLESLHSLSVDLTRMMEGDVKEKVWKIYQKGDISAFTKYLLEIQDKFPMPKIQDKYENDNEFRTYVNRFMRQFEEVYEQAMENDHGELLASIFSSSDIGELYGILCKISGRKSLVAKLSSVAA